MKSPKRHNDLNHWQMAKVLKFLEHLGPYQSDLWSNSYYSEVLEFIEEREKRRKNE